MKQESNQVVKKESTHMTVSDRAPTASTIDQKDVTIPRLLLAQNMSEVVSDGKAAIGDIYDSVSKEVLAKRGAAVDVVPLYHFKTWVISQEVKGKFEFRRIEKWTPSNSDLPWEYTEGGSNWKRTASLNFFVLTTAALKKEKEILAMLNSNKPLPAVLEMAKPMLLSFQSAGYKAGKILVDHFATIQVFQARGVKVDVFRNIFKLTSTQEKNEKGSWFAFHVENTKTSPTAEEQGICATWQREIAENASRLKVDQETPTTVVDDAPMTDADLAEATRAEAY